MAIAIVVLGLAMVGAGLSAWLGYYRAWTRGPLGDIYVPLAPSGIGVMVLGIGGLTGLHWLALLGAIFMPSGVLMYILAPGLLDPPWYRKLKRSPEELQAQR
jgi:hypothetical protein